MSDTKWAACSVSVMQKLALDLLDKDESVHIICNALGIGKVLLVTGREIKVTTRLLYAG